MQLVVMAAVLAVAGAGRRCSSNCNLTNAIIEVESCIGTVEVLTTICQGQCYQKDLVYISNSDWPEQETCNGEWSYEVKHIPKCPVGITYPVARSCTCAVCNKDHMFCGHYLGDTPQCLSH